MSNSKQRQDFNNVLPYPTQYNDREEKKLLDKNISKNIEHHQPERKNYFPRETLAYRSLIDKITRYNSSSKMLRSLWD